MEKNYHFSTGRATFEISFLFTVTRDEYSYVFWESSEYDKSKATHIFKIEKKQYDEVFEKIIEFFQANIKVRSKLNDENFEEKKELRYLCRIDHDYFEYQNWERRINQILNS